MYKRNIEAHLCNHCCCEKAINISYSEHMSVALGTQDAKCMHSTAIMWPVWFYHIFPHYLIQGHFSKKLIEH